jgi:hypothetical protein
VCGVSKLPDTPEEAAAEGRRTSVLLLRESVGEKLTRCPRATGWFWRNLTTGEMAPGRCAASSCPYCGPVEALARARVISDGGATGPPQRYIVLTLPPEQWGMEWQTLRQKMKDFRRAMVREHGEWEHAWTVERGKLNGMPHVNVLQKGTYVRQRELQDRWGGIAHVQAIRRQPGKVGGYVLKEAGRVAGYSLKDAHASLADHLAINGGRLVHLSRNYLGGETIPTVRKRLRGDSASTPGEWERTWGELPQDRQRAAAQMLANLVP